MDRTLHVWLNRSLWACWFRSTPVEPITLANTCLAEVVLQTAPGKPPLDGFPHGIHLRLTAGGLEIAPAKPDWRNPRGEIGSGWVAWQNALIDNLAMRCKAVISAEAEVQWALVAVHHRAPANTGLCLEFEARSIDGKVLGTVAYPPRFLIFPEPSEIAGGANFVLNRERLPDTDDWQTALRDETPPKHGFGKHPGDVELSALVQRLAPAFPHPGQPNALKLQLEDDWAVREAQRHDWHESICLPYWQRLAPAYVAALTEPFADDIGYLKVVVEDWPSTFVGQQQGLEQLLEQSKLRQSWRSLAQWQLSQRTLYTDGMRRISTALEQEHRECSRPLAEIPLYWGFIRASCQQVICLPVSQYEALYDSSTRYDPAAIDISTVSRLAHRIARLFNAPPSLPQEDLAEAPSRHQSIIWDCGLGSLTGSIDSHGMTDRLFDDYGRPQPAEYYGEGNVPTWRFDGFCGQLRVTLENGEQWYVTVLAPSHFLGALLRLPKHTDNQVDNVLG